MFICSYSHASDNFESLMDHVIDDNQPVEIQREKGGAAVLVEKNDFERYRKAALDAEFSEIMLTHGTAYTELSKM